MSSGPSGFNPPHNDQNPQNGQPPYPQQGQPGPQNGQPGPQYPGQAGGQSSYGAQQPQQPYGVPQNPQNPQQSFGAPQNPQQAQPPYGTQPQPYGGVPQQNYGVPQPNGAQPQNPQQPTQQPQQPYGAPAPGNPQYGNQQYGAPHYGNPNYGAPQYPLPAPPPQGRGKGCLIGALIGVGLFITAIIVVVALVVTSFNNAVNDALNGNGNGTPTPGAGTVKVEPVTEYNINERPTFASTKADIEGIYNKYANGVALQYVPHTTDGANYAKDFLYIIIDLKSAFGFMEIGGTVSTDAQELDAEIKRLGDEASEAERKFLAGEDLGVSITITRSDGSVYESDGSNKSAADSVEDAESFARSFTGTPDANGSYAASAEELVNKFGLVLDYKFSTIYDYCGSEPSVSDEDVVAAYCYAMPQRVFVNDGFTGYPGNLNEGAFIDTIKHELAHHLVGQACSTSSPTITGSANEGVASSYAVLFLGADRDYLQSVAGAYTQYGMSDETDALATGIHDNQTCSR